MLKLLLLVVHVNLESVFPLDEDRDSVFTFFLEDFVRLVLFLELCNHACDVVFERSDLGL